MCGAVEKMSSIPNCVLLRPLVPFSQQDFFLLFKSVIVSMPWTFRNLFETFLTIHSQLVAHSLGVLILFLISALQPPPPYEATSPSAPPKPAQTPPSRTTPTEPRNYGSYNSQVHVLLPPLQTPDTCCRTCHSRPRLAVCSVGSVQRWKIHLI